MEAMHGARGICKCEVKCRAADVVVKLLPEANVGDAAAPICGHVKYLMLQQLHDQQFL